MAAGNGFITYSPDTRFGASEEYFKYFTGGAVAAGLAAAQKFVVPGSGAMQCIEMGLYSYFFFSDQSARVKLAIYTHNEGNYPAARVDDSETSQLTVTKGTARPVKYSQAYGAAKPRVIGGATYWLAYFSEIKNNMPVFISYHSGSPVPSGNTVWRIGTYPSWPSFSSSNKSTRNTSIYAVYEEAPPPVSFIPRDQVRISAIDGNAFFDVSEYDTLTDCVGGEYKITVTDSTGKKLIGYIDQTKRGENYE